MDTKNHYIPHTRAASNPTQIVEEKVCLAKGTYSIILKTATTNICSQFCRIQDLVRSRVADSIDVVHRRNLVRGFDDREYK
jgi:hypothetical protein